MATVVAKQAQVLASAVNSVLVKPAYHLQHQREKVNDIRSVGYR